MGKSRVRTRQMNKTQYMMRMRQKALLMREHKKNKPLQNSDCVNNVGSQETSEIIVEEEPLCIVPFDERTDLVEQQSEVDPLLLCKREPVTNVDRLNQQHVETQNKLKFVRNVEQRMCKVKWISNVNNKQHEIEDETIYYVSAFTRNSNNDESVLSKNVNCNGDIYTQPTSNDSKNSSTNNRLQLLPMVAKVYLYLEKEYEYMKTLNGNNCDLSPLADILKRTAEATGVSEKDVISTLENEDLRDHLPERAKKLRQTIDLQHGRYCSDDDLISDEEMLEEEHVDIEVQKEKIGGEEGQKKKIGGEEVQKEKLGEGANEPTPCGSTVIQFPSDEQTKMQLEQVYLREARDTSHTGGDSSVTSEESEPEEDEVSTSVNNLLLQLEPPRTKATVSSDDRNTMEIEQYTFVICNRGETSTTTDPEDIAVKLESLDE